MTTPALDFSNLKEASVRADATAWCILDMLRGAPQLELAPLTEHNAALLNDQLRANTIQRPRKAKSTPTTLEDAADVEAVQKTWRESRFEPLAKHAIRGWRGIRNAEGVEVPFTPEAARAWLTSLLAHAPWIFDLLIKFCENASNFTDGAIGAADVDVISGNSEGG